jgi:hypothetical protein
MRWFTRSDSRASRRTAGGTPLSSDLLPPGLRPSASRRTGKIRYYGRGTRFFLSQVARVPAYLCGRPVGRPYQQIEVALDHREAGASAMRHDRFTATCAGGDAT